MCGYEEGRLVMVTTLKPNKEKDLGPGKDGSNGLPVESQKGDG